MICRGFFLQSNIYNSINLFAVCLPVTNIIPIFVALNADSTAIPQSIGYCSQYIAVGFFIAQYSQKQHGCLIQ